jgi:cytochrome bd-type quinol oxidase subunit 2
VPWVYAQVAGAALVGLAWILWRSSHDAGAQRVVAQGASIVNIVAFVCIGIWLFSDDEGIPGSGSFGSWTFDAIAVILVVLGILEARAFRAPRE